MEITETMMYDFAKLIRADLDVYGLGEGNNTRIGLKRPLFRSDLEKIFERWCPDAEEVQKTHDKLVVLLKENSRLSCLISSKEDRINELENMCDDYTEANNDLGERLANANENIKSLNAALVKADRKIEIATNECIGYGIAKELYENKISELKEEKRVIKDAYEVLVEKSKELIDEKKRLQEENERLGKQNKTLCASNDMLHSSNMVLKLKTESIAKLKEENQEYIKANEELGKRISELSSKLYLLECEKAMSNFTKIFAGGEADCSKCIWRENSEKKDERITELMNENDLINKRLIKKDNRLGHYTTLYKAVLESYKDLSDKNKKFRVTICDQNDTINNLKSELERAIKDRDRAYKKLHDKKENTHEMENRKLRKQRDKAVNDFKSLKASHESMVLQRNHYKGLTEKLDCCNNSLRDDLNNLKENFVQFGGCDVLHRVYDNLYVVDDGKHVKGFIIVNKDYTKELTNVMTYYTFRNIFALRLACTGGDKLFTEFTLPKAHYDLAVYSE